MTTEHLAAMIDALKQAEPDDRGLISMTPELRDLFVDRLTELHDARVDGPPAGPPRPHLRGGT